MEKIKSPLYKIDRFQQKHRFTAFTAAVIKKYGDDKGGNLAALITYYGFLSLFPLLLVATTATHIFLKTHIHLRDQITNGIDKYFPAIGGDLQDSIHGFHKTGLALFFGILLTLYGARGGAAAIRYAFNQIWDVPEEKRPGFPLNVINSLLIILVGGGGLILASVLGSYAAGTAGGFGYKAASFIISLIIIIFVFYNVFSLAINSRQPTRKDLLVSAVSAAVGVAVLQLFGGYLLTHQLKNASHLYGTFAIVLGLMFWIYLQAQVLIFAAIAGSVRSRRLWPRKLF